MEWVEAVRGRQVAGERVWRRYSESPNVINGIGLQCGPPEAVGE